MKIIVCGDRNWTDQYRIEEVLKEIVPPDAILIHGNARGADKIAGKIWEALHPGQTVPVPADWNTYGKAAGPIRNRQMLDQKPWMVIAFHHNLDISKGTKDCVTEARKRRIIVVLVN